MTTASPEYEWEIREWLVGRIERRRTTLPLHTSVTEHVTGRASLWWIFEGKRYDFLDAPLAESWEEIAHHVDVLLRTYNPRWREEEAPEGETDWLASSFASLTSGRRRFVTRASATGLVDAERRALLGWCGWIAERWTDFLSRLEPAHGVSSGPPWEPDRSDWGVQRLRTHAQVALRSRWPFLRHVVAGSLRAALELQEIDRIPLPQDRASLFELVCMVRILDFLNPRPTHIRWLNPDMGGNTVELPGMSYGFQESISGVLESPEYGAGLRQAMRRHRVRVPRQMDGLLRFTRPMRGYTGIIIEAKSGSQSFDAAIYQLKAYRAAVQAAEPGNYLVWGIIEGSDESDIHAEALDQLEAESTPDTWVFSSADRIPDVLTRLLGRADRDAVSS